MMKLQQKSMTGLFAIGFETANLWLEIVYFAWKRHSVGDGDQLANEYYDNGEDEFAEDYADENGWMRCVWVPYRRFLPKWWIGEEVYEDGWKIG